MPDEPAHVGLGRPRQPKEQVVAPGGALAGVWAAVAAGVGAITGHGSPIAEVGERAKALRGQRLAGLKNLEAPPDIWVDIEAVLLDCFDATLRQVMAKELDPDALVSLVNILATFDNSLAQGQAALQRLAQRRMRAAVAAQTAKDGP